MPQDERRRRATEAADAIRRRYGSKAIRRARLLGSGVAEPFERDPMSAPEGGSIGRARHERPTRTAEDSAGAVPARAGTAARDGGGEHQARGLTFEQMFG